MRIARIWNLKGFLPRGVCGLAAHTINAHIMPWISMTHMKTSWQVMMPRSLLMDSSRPCQASMTCPMETHRWSQSIGKVHLGCFCSQNQPSIISYFFTSFHRISLKPYDTIKMEIKNAKNIKNKILSNSLTGFASFPVGLFLFHPPGEWLWKLLNVIYRLRKQ